MHKTIVLILAWIAAAACVHAAAPAFYPDDPIQSEPDPENAANVQPRDIDLFYDLVENLFTRPGDSATNVRAQNINTIDEVPDSNWFTNRIGSRPMTVEEVVRAGDTTEGPAAGPWTILSARNTGVVPEFTIRDVGGSVWHIQFDAPGHHAMATGTAVVVTKLMWALGYFVPENHIARLKPEELVMGPGTKITTPAGKTRSMKKGDIKELLHQAARESDGSYRVAAGLALPGKPLGGFQFYGTRPDDPNDIVPHEHRRELRGYRVFAAWFNDVDSRAIHSLDTLITEDGNSSVRHNLLDFGCTMGSASTRPREAWEGYEYLFEGAKPIGKDLIAVGFRVEPWRRIPMYESRSVGRLTLDNTEWDPEAWVPRAPNAAFVRARADDKFWAARKAMAVTDEMIRAVVRTGRFDDPASEAFLTKAMIDRRNAIGRKYLTALNPIIDPKLGGALTFGNAAVTAGFATDPENYSAKWFRFDNATGTTTSLGTTTSPKPAIDLPAGLPSETGTFVKVEIRALHKDFPSWEQPVTAYFQLAESGWKLKGLLRGKGL